MIRGFLVDLDGTLVDTRLANLAAYREAFSILGIINDEKALEDWVGVLPWDQMLSMVLSPSDSHRKNEVATLKREIYPQYFHMVRLNEALVELLKFSKSSSMHALVTSASRSSVLSLLKHLGVIDLFDITITSDDCKLRKPNPEPYILAATQLNLMPGECLVIEDSDVGIESALAFGAKVLKVRW